MFWKFFDEEREREASEGNECNNYKGVMARAYRVFNAAQVDGYDVPVLPRLPETERIEHAEQFFGGLHADIREGGSRAFYSPAEDYIQMPPFTAFKKADFRYSVLAHEVTHWSGATIRLNRDLAPCFQKEAYAAEELVAELGSSPSHGSVVLHKHLLLKEAAFHLLKQSFLILWDTVRGSVQNFV